MEQIALEYKDDRIDPNPHTWDKTNTKKAIEFGRLLPQELKWLEQAVKVLVNENLNGKGRFKHGSISAISYDPKTERVTINLRNTFHYNPTEVEGLAGVYTADFNELRRFSLEGNGITLPSLDTLLNDYPKFSLIKKVYEENPSRIKLVTSENPFSGKYVQVAIMNAEGKLPLERISLDEVPLSEADKEMLKARDKLTEYDNSIFNVLMNVDTRLNEFSLRSILINFSTYRRLKKLQKSLPSLSSRLRGLSTRLNNNIFYAKARGSSVESISPEIIRNIDALVSESDGYISEISGKN